MEQSDKKKKVLSIIGKIIVYGFALAGFGIIAAWAIFQLGLTNNNGRIDKNNRYLMEISEMNNGSQSNKEETVDNSQLALDYYKIMCISRFYPRNANLILEALNSGCNPKIIEQMIRAVELHIASKHDIDKEYKKLTQQGEEVLAHKSNAHQNDNAIAWMNSSQWEALKDAILMEKPTIDSAAAVAGIEPRLIVCTLIGEQIRLYNTNREVFKSYLGPVKVLVTETKFSMGVTGIKEPTAMRIERYLRKPESPFYINEKFEDVLAFETENDSLERITRLTDNTNHYYSYLYAGIMLHQFKKQWERAGFNIANNAGILATLFNLGFDLSVPKAAPEIGGAQITIHGTPYTFGGLAFDFYFSGEMMDAFPYYDVKFKE